MRIVALWALLATAQAEHHFKPCEFAPHEARGATCTPARRDFARIHEILHRVRLSDTSRDEREGLTSAGIKAVNEGDYATALASFRVAFFLMYSSLDPWQ
jgi:hypothetical protein